MRDLTDQVAVVTGASGGIGGAVARRLAERGVRLSLWGRDDRRLEELASACRQSAPEVWIEALELTDDAELEAAAERTIATLGGVDLLIHSAGAFHLGTVADSGVGELDHVYRVNVRAPYLLTQRLLPPLRERQGQIVFVNSTAGVRPRGGSGPYAASKAALKALADALRDEVNPDGVRVISVYPGRTATAMQQEVRRLEGLPYEPETYMQASDVAASILHALTLPETAELTEVFLRPMAG